MMDIKKMQEIANKIKEAYKYINKLSIEELEEFISYVNGVEDIYSLTNPAGYNEMYDDFEEARKRAKMLLKIKKEIRRYV